MTNVPEIEPLKNNTLQKLLAAAVLLLGTTACSQEDDPAGDENDDASAATTEPTSDVGEGSTSISDDAWTISVGAFTLDGDTYVDTGIALTFDSKAECQTWSRTAQGDAHDSDSHPHFNAATDASYDAKSFSWTEYGPELDQASIEATCAQGTGGVTKTVDENSYYQDKPNLYLKLIGAVQN